MRDRVFIGLGTTLLAAALSLGACGDDEDSPATPTTATSTTSTTTAPGGAKDEPPTGSGAGGVDLELVGEFEEPVFITQAAGGSDLYVVERCGRIQRVPAAGGDPELFLDLSELITCEGSEQGLLSVAFDPAADQRFYVYYTDTEGNERIAEYRRDAGDPSRADPESARELVLIEDFASNHNGGLLLFGPDGALYAGTGDGGGAGDPERTAQDPESPLGKLLEVDTASGAVEPVAIGLRNPWRYSFDAVTDDLWIGDVGQDTLEEIDAVSFSELGPELNFGWSAFEGTQRFNDDQEAPGARPPVFEYGRDRGCSVTGGYVVRDRALPTLYGRYLFGDYCAGELRSFTASPDREATDERPLGLEVPALSSFGEDLERRLYAVSLEGPVYRLVAEETG